MVGGILDGLRWLGLEWDEGPDIGGPHAPYFQTGRLDRHRAAAERLLDGGHAYISATAPPERLQAARAEAEAKGEGWIYDRRCPVADVGADRGARGGAPSRAPSVVRVPEGRTTFNDLVHGPITVEHRTIEDFVILRSDGQPTYQLLGRLRRRGHGDHARGPRRRSHLEHAEADPALPGARCADAGASRTCR